MKLVHSGTVLSALRKAATGEKVAVLLDGAQATACLAVAAALAGSGCATALRGTGASLAADLGFPGARPAPSAASALEEARAAFARRADREAVRSAAHLFASTALDGLKRRCERCRT